jgi:hypothetical protein
MIDAMSNNPIVDFTGVSRADATATYANLPANAKILFVDKTNGRPFGGIVVSGGGSATIPAAPDMPAGDYYLEARDSTGAYLAQSVEFYFVGA